MISNVPECVAVLPPVRASAWLDALSRGETSSLIHAYGSAALVTDRIPLLGRVLRTFVGRFGDRAVRIFRCPGRINLRGMHVDTHGGFINLMTHQREVVVASAPSDSHESKFVNNDTIFPEIVIDTARWSGSAAFDRSWNDFITSADVQAYVGARRGHWANYVEGSLLRALHAHRDFGEHGLCAAVGSDVPRGASLSSSTALSLAVYMSAIAWNGAVADLEELIPVAQDIEWFTGARIGTSDQSAMLLPNANEIVTFAPTASGALPELRRTIFPADLRILVIDSHTERSLSGAEQLDYTRNRFAYSLALQIVRQQLNRGGVARERVEGLRRLSDFAAPLLDPIGGVRGLYDWLQRVPETLSLEALRSEYLLPDLDEVYTRYFGPLPERERPTQFSIRGPLLFGIAESERGRVFADAIVARDYARAGQLMSRGHDGDRRFDRLGARWSPRVDVDCLVQAREKAMPLEDMAGAYGASSRALDALVDCALEAGALGASLTGAGIAGTVLALCKADCAEAVAERLRNFIASDAYRAVTRRAYGFDETVARASVVSNTSPASASELTLQS